MVLRHEKLHGQFVQARGKPSARMDTSAMGPMPGSGMQQEPTAASDPWGSGLDPWACQPCNPGGGDLDAFGKGSKGKGKQSLFGKGGQNQVLDCWNCLGHGHPARLCPSPQGSGLGKKGPQCPICKGWGHGKETCTSPGGGNYSPPAAKGKKGVKGDGKV